MVASDQKAFANRFAAAKLRYQKFDWKGNGSGGRSLPSLRVIESNKNGAFRYCRDSLPDRVETPLRRYGSSREHIIHYIKRRKANEKRRGNPPFILNDLFRILLNSPSESFFPENSILRPSFS